MKSECLTLIIDTNAHVVVTAILALRENQDAKIVLGKLGKDTHGGSGKKQEILPHTGKNENLGSGCLVSNLDF